MTRPRPARPAAVRIVDHALGLLRLGLPSDTAIRIAIDRFGTSPAACDRARACWRMLLDRAKREGASRVAA